MDASFSYDNAPPFSAPFRYFLTAPWFGIAAGLVLMYYGPAFYASRWMPATLAFTHLITLGFMMMIMVGALIQILPVVMGVRLVLARQLASWTHLGLTLGSGGLAAAFLSGYPGMFVVASLFLGSALGLFLVSTSLAAFRGDPGTPSLSALKSSFLGLAGTLILGLLLALSLAGARALPYAALTDLHAAWGLGAWSGILLAALSYITVPMFQLTPLYPAPVRRWLPRMLMAGVLLWSLAVVTDIPWGSQIAVCLLALAGGSFVLTTLALQRKRRRARRDPGFLFWQLGMVSALLALLMLIGFVCLPVMQTLQRPAILFACLLGVGGYVSLMTGMLYKIVPFLAWLHLQNLPLDKSSIPSMARLLPEVAMRRQLAAHAGALGLLMAAAFWSETLARLAGLAFLLSQWMLFRNLLQVGLAYRKLFQTAFNFAVREGGDEG